MTERDLARINGDPIYKGAPCPLGHLGYRYVTTGRCMPCAKESSRNAMARRRQARESGNEELLKVGIKPLRKRNVGFLRFP